MIEKFCPGGHASDVFSIDYQKLYDRGYRGILFDIDNTLVHHGDDSTEKIDELFHKIHSIGLRTLLLSNNGEERIKRFNRNISTLYIADADKPNPDAYLKAVGMLGVKKSECICIGDQIFTDIYGANQSGMESVLVDFIRLPGEKWFGKRRILEKIILKLYYLKSPDRNGMGKFYRWENN